MRFVYGKQELCTRQRAEDVSVLLTNGLGGYLSTTAAFSAPRCDQGLLAAAVQAPNRRVMLVHRLKEVLRIGQKETFLSTQSFAEEAAEDGWKNLSSFTYQYTPCWRYHVGGVMVERKLALGWEENTAAALYTVENRSGRPCTLEIVPQLKFAPKEDALKKPDKTFRFENGKVTSGGETMHVFTDAALAARPVQWEKLHYTADEKDGRPAFGYAASCFSITRTVEAGETAQFEVVFFTGETAASGTELLRQQEMRLAALEKKAGFADPAASRLAAAADAFIARRASTNGKTILAGYPLFSDWGRDTMIALPGCCLETGRYEDDRVSDHHLVHGTLGGLRVRKGHLPYQFAVLHGLHRPVEHAGKGIRRYLVRPLLRRRGAGVHPHCDPVHDHPEILSGGNERRSQGLMPGLPRPMHPKRRTPLCELFVHPVSSHRSA